MKDATIFSSSQPLGWSGGGWGQFLAQLDTDSPPRPTTDTVGPLIQLRQPKIAAGAVTVTALTFCALLRLWRSAGS